MPTAPIALFVYDRPAHTRQTLKSLQENYYAPDSDLYIFSDGPKDIEAITAVTEVRRLISETKGFRSIRIVSRDNNLGLAKSIISGVTQLCEEFDRIIVLEDDMLLSRYFLRYMNDGLRVYETNEKVASIHGYTYPLNIPLPETFFLRGADCWGWGTWRRAWQQFEPDGEVLLEQLTNSGQGFEFDSNGTAPNMQMLKNQIAGRVNSWAIRWHAATFLKDMYTLYPGQSLVRNIGLDGSGTHKDELLTFDTDLAQAPIKVSPTEVIEDTRIRQALSDFFRRIHGEKRSFLTRVVRKIRQFI